MNGVSGRQIFLLTVYVAIATAILALIGLHIADVLGQGNAILAHICQATPHCTQTGAS